MKYQDQTVQEDATIGSDVADNTIEDKDMEYTEEVEEYQDNDVQINQDERKYKQELWKLSNMKTWTQFQEGRT